MTNIHFSKHIAPIVLAFLWLQFALLALFITFTTITHYFSTAHQHESYTDQRAQEIVALVSRQNVNQQLTAALNDFIELDKQILTIKIISNKNSLFFYEQSKIGTATTSSFLPTEFFPQENRTIKKSFPVKIKNNIASATLTLTTTPPLQTRSMIEISIAVFFALFTAIALLCVNKKIYLETQVTRKKIDLAFAEKTEIPSNTSLSDSNLQFLADVNHAIDSNLIKQSTTNTLFKEKNNEPTLTSTEASLNQRELEIARTSATRANRLKSKFIANTSHELLTPLNSIVGFSELLIDAHSKNQQQQKFAACIHENALHLTTLVNDLVVFSNKSNNNLSLNYKVINVYELLQSIASVFSLEAEKKSLEFIINIDATQQLNIETDPVRLRQIIYNLIVNAIRNTDQGHISLLASLDTKKQALTISICDTGCGIDIAKQENIFEAFVGDQNVSADKSKPGLGFGLGLAIVAELTDLLGANITLKSKINEGSQFDLSIPLKDSNKNVAIAAKEKRIEKPNPSNGNDNITENNAPRIFITDDNESNVCLLDHLLTNEGCIVESSTDGGNALKKIAAKKYDLIILDIRMAPLDGFDVFTKIKQGKKNPLTPIIACTAHTSENEYRRLLDFGFNKVIHKPLTSKEIQQLLSQYVSSPAPCTNKKPVSEQLSDSSETASASFNKKNNNDPFDVDLAIQLAGGNHKVAKKIFDLLVKDLEKSVHLHNNNTFVSVSLLLEHIHQLNGAAALTGATALKKQANHLEGILKSTLSINDSEVVNEHNKLFNIIQSLLAWSKNQNLEKVFKICQ